MTNTTNNKGFWNKVWREAEPVIAHAVVVLLLEISLLLIGLVTLGLESIFPKQDFYFSIIEKVDIWLALVLLCLFGVYTLIGVGIRLIKELLGEVQEWRFGKKEDV